MEKRKCAHCGYKFKPKDEKETICDLCKIQLRDDSGPKREFDAKWLRVEASEIKGKLSLSSEKVVFEPYEVYYKDKKMEIVLSRIKDVRLTTQKEVDALRVFLLGTQGGVLWPKKLKMLTVDYEDENGIVQHPIFEGADMETALHELNEIRRTTAEVSKACHCKYCGAKNKSTETICVHCGALLP